MLGTVLRVSWGALGKKKMMVHYLRTVTNLHTQRTCCMLITGSVGEMTKKCKEWGGSFIRIGSVSEGLVLPRIKKKKSVGF